MDLMLNSGNTVNYKYSNEEIRVVGSSLSNFSGEGHVMGPLGNNISQMGCLRVKKLEKERNGEYVNNFITINVQTMGEFGSFGKGSGPADKLPGLVYEMVKKGIDVVALQETRWVGAGELEYVEYLSKQRFTCFRSGHASLRCRGVGILLQQAWVAGIAKVHYVSDRIMWISGNFDGIHTAMFSVYAPTAATNTTDEERSIFYEMLDAELTKAACHSKVVVLGDFNARIGQDRDQLWRSVRGQWNIRDILNDNGERLLHLCEHHDLFVANTIIRAPHSRVGTWCHLPTRQYFTIDHILISRDRKGEVLECCKTENFFVQSDHFPLKLTCKASNKRLGRAVRCNMFRGRRKKALTVRRDFSKLSVDALLCKRVSQRIDEIIESHEFASQTDLQEALQIVISELVPVREKRAQRATWWDANIIRIDELFGEQERLQRAYYFHSSPVTKGAFKKYKVLVQKELRQMELSHWKAICDDMISKASVGDSRAYHAALKEMFGEQQKVVEKKVLKKADGSLTTSSEDTLKTMLLHSKALLNQPGSAEVASVERFLPDQEGCIDLLGDPFTLEELLRAITNMQFNKACGPDAIPVEFWNYAASEKLMAEILRLFNLSLATGVVDASLRDVIIQFLHKKGDKSDCNNYRTLSLINHIGKMLERMVMSRLTKIAEEKGWNPESQNGFRNKRGTVDSLYCLRLVNTYCRENKRPCFIAFVDLTKAYDKVDRGILWLVLGRLGVPSNMIELIKGMHDGSRARVREGGVFSDEFSLEMGLKQGSVFAPLLFNIFFGAIIKAIRKSFSVNRVDDIKLRVRMEDPLDPVPFQKRGMSKAVSLSELLFADDSAFLAASEEGLQVMLSLADEILRAYGQEISIKKTEVMRVKPRGPLEDVTMGSIILRDQHLGATTSFKYVGSLINDSASMSTEIDGRIRMMSAAYRKMRVNLLENRRLSRKLRMSGFVAYVLTAALYGCETWNARAVDIGRLESVQFRYLRRMLGYTWEDRKSFATIIHECRQAGVDILPIGMMISRARLSYLGHTLRMDDDRLPKMLLHAQLTAVAVQQTGRMAGGQEFSYKDAIKNDIDSFALLATRVSSRSSYLRWNAVVALASDRNAWRKAVKTEGIQHCLDTWYAAEAVKSNKRHETTDGVNFVSKLPYSHSELNIKVVGLSKAIESGAVCVGRGQREKKGPVLPLRRPPHIPYARVMLTELLEIRS